MILNRRGQAGAIIGALVGFIVMFYLSRAIGVVLHDATAGTGWLQTIIELLFPGPEDTIIDLFQRIIWATAGAFGGLKVTG